MPRWAIILAIVVIVAYLWLTMTRGGQQMAGKFPFPVPPLFGVNRGGGVPGL